METETRAIHTFKEGDLFDNRYRLISRAGTGGFADVWRAEDTKRNNKVVALKIYTRLDDDGIKDLSKEFDETEEIRHTNLLTSNHFATVGNIPYLVMNYCEGGNMSRYAGRLSDAELQKVVRDIGSGLAHLHREGIVHQDIKPENILFNSKRGRYMLSDFGISSKSRTRLSKSAKMEGKVSYATLAYAPPEKFSSNPADRQPDAKSDIFSLGVTLYELATGVLPFEQPVNTGDYMLEKQGNVQIYFDHIANPQLRHVVERCMSYRKEDRPTAVEVLDMIDSRENGGAGTVKLKPGSAIGVKKEKNHTIAGNALRFFTPKKIYLILTVVVCIFLLYLFFSHIGSASHYENVIPIEETVVETETPMGDKLAVWENEGDNMVFTIIGKKNATFTMVHVKGGQFTMGCTSEQGKDCFSDETPTHRVTLSDYYIGQTEVTQELWEAVMDESANVSSSIGEGPDVPVYNVGYVDVCEFYKRLSDITRCSFRLPTEAEWEFAARGGTRSRGYKYSGGNILDSVGWYYGNSHDKVHPVAKKRANELGIYDMSGNLNEYCSDHYDEYSSVPQHNPQGPPSGYGQVIRGGAWNCMIKKLCRVSYRDYIRGDDGGQYYGLRLAL